MSVLSLHDTKGVIFDIQRFSIHDGPGIRTTVFFKGCPLRCVWCHNPESLVQEQEIAYYASKCLNCGSCKMICPQKLHFIGNEGNKFSRESCLRCGKCVNVCFSGAMVMIGKTVNAGDIIKDVKKDEAFYNNSNGGMTLSGGEPFFQPEFSLALLKLAKADGLHTCVETCGAVPFNVLQAASEVTDLFLYDVKETDNKKHRKYTGVSNETILKNLENLDSLGSQIVLRCPIIPGLNDYEGHLQKLGVLANMLKNVVNIDLEPYHPLGISKGIAIGKTSSHTDPAIPSKEWSSIQAEKLRRYTEKPVFVS